MQTDFREIDRQHGERLRKEIATVAAAFGAGYRFRLNEKARLEVRPHELKGKWLRMTPGGWRDSAAHIQAQTGVKLGPRRLRRLLEYAAVAAGLLPSPELPYPFFRT